jgi:hypothetical protein
VLNRPIDAVRCKRGELWTGSSLILHNALAHFTWSVAVFSRKRHFRHRLSAILSWLGFSWLLCPKLKSVLKQKRFLDVEDLRSVQKNIETFLFRILKSHSHVYCQHFQLLPHPPIRFIRHTTILKSFDHHFWRDLLPWSWSTGSGFTLDTFVLMISEHSTLVRTVRNKIVSNDH